MLFSNSIHTSFCVSLLGSRTICNVLDSCEEKVLKVLLYQEFLLRLNKILVMYINSIVNDSIAQIIVFSSQTDFH